MKRLASLIFLAGVLTSPLAGAQEAVVAGAISAAEQWLALADAGNGGDTWGQAAPSFQAAVPKTAWPTPLQRARQPLGAVVSRKLASSAFTRTLPGAPDGEYVVIQYDTEFKQKAHAVETVVPAKGTDGVWRVSGYFVR